MTPDQELRLESLSTRLTEVVLTDADPDHWVGNGLRPDELTQQQRGDAYWCRKMAVSTLLVLTRVQWVIGNAREHVVDTPENHKTLDREIANAEREASKLMDKMQSEGKAAFDKYVHGKR
jgi:hypothetical protein